MRKNKLSSMLLSLAVAFCLWLYVFSNISQSDDRTFYNIPVVMEGESKLTEQNLMITGKSAETVSVHLSGTRSDLNKLDSSNIIAKANLSNIEEPGERISLSYTLSYPPDIPNNAFVVESKNPGAIFVDVDYRRTKEIEVKVKYTGERSENYIYDTENALLDISAVTVSGPASVVDRIDHAQVELDLTDRLESVSESFRYTLCDQEGEPVDAQLITTNVEEIRLEMQIQKIEAVTLTVDPVYAGGATAQNTTITINPATIRVSGGEAVLEEFGDSYNLGTINLADLEKTINELKFSISLPEGLTNQTGVTEATVLVRFSGLKTREFTIENIEAINVPEGMSAEIINASVVVKVRGPAAQIDALTEADIRAAVDFANAEIGNATYRVTLTFGEGFSGVGALKTVSVSALVQED